MKKDLTLDESYDSLYTSVVRLCSRADSLVLHLRRCFSWLSTTSYSNSRQLLTQCEKSSTSCKRSLCSGTIWLGQRWVVFLGGDQYSLDLPWRDVQNLHTIMVSTLLTLEGICLQLSQAQQGPFDNAAFQQLVEEIKAISDRADTLRSLALLFFEMHLGNMPAIKKNYFFDSLYYEPGAFIYEVLEVKGYPLSCLRGLILRHSKLEFQELFLTRDVAPGAARIKAFSEMLKLKEEFGILTRDWSEALFPQRNRAQVRG